MSDSLYCHTCEDEDQCVTDQGLAITKGVSSPHAITKGTFSTSSNVQDCGRIVRPAGAPGLQASYGMASANFVSPSDGATPCEVDGNSRACMMHQAKERLNKDDAISQQVKEMMQSRTKHV